MPTSLGEAALETFCTECGVTPADDHVASLHRLGREPVVGVQRVVVHRDHAEQVVVVLGDRLARPVADALPAATALSAGPPAGAPRPLLRLVTWREDTESASFDTAASA